MRYKPLDHFEFCFGSLKTDPRSSLMTKSRFSGSVLLLAITIPLICALIGCQGLTKTATTATTTGNSLQTSVNHIIFIAQENRSFDHYFGAMRQYWANYGYPDQAFDGLPQFPTNAASGAPPANPGCDPAFAFPGSDCTMDSQSPPVQSYHLSTQCVENPSPSWNESHVDFNLSNPSSGTATLDGYVSTAVLDPRTIQLLLMTVTDHRPMAYSMGGALIYTSLLS